jgi:hypothetical protein
MIKGAGEDLDFAAKLQEHWARLAQDSEPKDVLAPTNLYLATKTDGRARYAQKRGTGKGKTRSPEATVNIDHVKQNLPNSRLK